MDNHEAWLLEKLVLEGYNNSWHKDVSPQMKKIGWPKTFTMTWLEKLKSVAAGLKLELKAYQIMLKDPRTPRVAKVLLGLAVGYALLPFDLIPDFIPIIGHLDDVVIVPTLIIVALRMIPKEVVNESRLQAQGGS